MILPQIIFNMTLFLMGFVVLTISFKEMETKLRYLLSFFAGMGLWSFVSTLLIILTFKFCVLSVISGYFVIVILIISIRKKCGLSNSLSFETVSLLKFMLLFVLANVLIYHLFRITNLTPDSLRYLGLAHNIADSGFYAAKELHFSDYDVAFYAIARMSFLPSLLAGSYLFGIDFYNTLYPLASIFFLLLMSQIIVDHTAQFDIGDHKKRLVSLSLPIMLMSIPIYRYHSMYVNQNLFACFYYSLCFLFILSFAKSDKLYWLQLGGFCLGLTTLMRSEISVFCLIPTALLLSIKTLKCREYFTFTACFLAISVPWQIFKTMLAIKANAGFDPESHNNLISLIMQWVSFSLMFFAVICIYVPLLRKMLLHAPAILMSVMLVALIVLLITKGPDTIKSLSGLGRVLFFKKFQYMHWSGFWYALVAILIMSTRFLRIKIIASLFYSTISYMLIRIIIYSLATRAMPSSSGSRILLHVLPVFCYFMILTVLHFVYSSDNSNNSELSIDSFREGEVL